MGAAAAACLFLRAEQCELHVFGMIHPRFRTAFLLQGSCRQEGRSLKVRVGTEIPAESGNEDFR